MITLNAWHCGFKGDAASVHGATPERVRWVFDRPGFDGVTIFEDAAMWADGVDSVRAKYRVGWLHEPRALHPHYYELAVKFRAAFDCILTHDTALIDSYPDSFRLAIHGGVSVPPAQWGMHPKSKDVAMLLSDKDTTPNHLLRHEIARSVPGIDVYRDLYGQAKLDTLKDYRFMVVVENSSEPNWWTEHVLDAIALGCVPIYYYPDEAGNAPHSLEAYLNIAGLWLWADDDLPAIVRHLNEFAETAYAMFLPYVAENIARLPELVTPEDWFVQHALRDLPCCQP